MNPIPGTHPNYIGTALLRLLPSMTITNMKLTLPAKIVLHKSGRPRRVWRGWKVVAGPEKCTVERGTA